MTLTHIGLILLLFVNISCSKDTSNNDAPMNTVSYTNKVSPDRMTLVLAAPSVNDPYYRSRFEDIVDFQVNYAKAIIDNDNVIIITGISKPNNCVRPNAQYRCLELVIVIIV